MMPNSTGSTRWGILVALFSLAASTLSWTLSGGEVFSPGTLSAARDDSTRWGGVGSHAELRRRCGACHPAPLSGKTMSGLCAECHRDIAAQLGDSTTLHGSLEDAQACLTCHTEHRGAGGELTRFAGSQAKGFLRKHVESWGSDCKACHSGANQLGRRSFSHDSTGYQLTGEHGRVACTECHAGVRTLAGFRDAPTDCAACHAGDDRHRGGFGRDCAACHDARSWEGARFDHSFPIDHGEQGRVACRTCHNQPGSWKSYTCYGCHEHTPALIAREHREEGVGRKLDDCVRCHASGRGEEGERGHGWGHD
jgi:hypothetical protein